MKAEKLFRSMKRALCPPNLFTYTALINAFAKEGLCEKAEELFAELQEFGFDPDVYTYNALLEAYRLLGADCELNCLSCFCCGIFDSEKLRQDYEEDEEEAGC